MATVAYFVLAAEGTRRLARLWFDDAWAVAAVAAVYAWNGAIVMYTISGHALTMAYAFLLNFANDNDLKTRPGRIKERQEDKA